jgi:transposase
MSKKYTVELSTEQRRLLLKLISTGKAPARTLTRARILLKADQGEGQTTWSDDLISKALDVSVATIHRVRQQFVDAGLQSAINHSPPRRRYARKLNNEARALLVTLLYAEPPSGRDRWTAHLLAERLVEFGYTENVSRETVRKALKEKGLVL